MIYRVNNLRRVGLISFDCHSIGILIRPIPVYDFETSELVSGGRDS
jgi:hypothetical protein